jgi:hypothetical protein
MRVREPNGDATSGFPPSGTEKFVRKSGFEENLVKPPEALNLNQAIDSVGEINLEIMA